MPSKKFGAFSKSDPNEFEQDKLDILQNIKKEVKQVMEEAVTKKFIHESSSSVISLCGSLEQCFLHRPKRRSVTLFKYRNPSFAFLERVGKVYDPAKIVVETVLSQQHTDDPLRKTLQLSTDSNKSPSKPDTLPCAERCLWIKIAIIKHVLISIIRFLSVHSSQYYEVGALLADECLSGLLLSLLEGPCSLELSRMRTTDHVWSDPHAEELVLRHRVHGASLTLPALTQHPRRPPLILQPGGRKEGSSSSSSIEEGSGRSLGSGMSGAAGPPLSPHPTHAAGVKECIQSLHQNPRMTLLYGKNNVVVQPRCDVGKLSGYLSLHVSPEGLFLSWTPNQLMSGQSPSSSPFSLTAKEEEDDLAERSQPLSSKLYAPISGPGYVLMRKSLALQNLFWEYALRVNFEDIVYIHCHHCGSSGGSLILVCLDGIQRPPIQFPSATQLLSFLICLENGLLPTRMLEPPLRHDPVQGKTFPKVKVRRSPSGRKHSSVPEEGTILADDVDESPADYVFRIIKGFEKKDAIEPADNELSQQTHPPHAVLDFQKTLDKLLNKIPFHSSKKKSSRVSELSNRVANTHSDPVIMGKVIVKQADISGRRPKLMHTLSTETRRSLTEMCSSLRRQVMSRAFYGWLAHCRHVKTVRDHLSGLVITSTSALNDQTQGLTKEFWESLDPLQQAENETKIHEMIYRGGMDRAIRHQVWPYLLGHYSFGSSESQRVEADSAAKTHYERTMSAWTEAEEVTKQRDREAASAVATAGRVGGDNPVGGDRGDGCLADDLIRAAKVGGKKSVLRKASTLSSDVFFGEEDEEEHTPETVSPSNRHPPLQKRMSVKEMDSVTKLGEVETPDEANTLDEPDSLKYGNNCHCEQPCGGQCHKLEQTVSVTVHREEIDTEFQHSERRASSPGSVSSTGKSRRNSYQNRKQMTLSSADYSLYNNNVQDRHILAEQSLERKNSWQRLDGRDRLSGVNATLESPTTPTKPRRFSTTSVGGEVECMGEIPEIVKSVAYSSGSESELGDSPSPEIALESGPSAIKEHHPDKSAHASGAVLTEGNVPYATSDISIVSTYHTCDQSNPSTDEYQTALSSSSDTSATHESRTQLSSAGSETTLVTPNDSDCNSNDEFTDQIPTIIKPSLHEDYEGSMERDKGEVEGKVMSPQYSHDGSHCDGDSEGKVQSPMDTMTTRSVADTVTVVRRVNGRRTIDSPDSDGDNESEEIQYLCGGKPYSVSFLDEMSLNFHRVDKDVHRCDRTFWYFTEEANLLKLRHIMCTYVWEHMDIGYMQGMCDLAAPLLVLFDSEWLVYSCFCELMKTSVDNFPVGKAMDNHLANLGSLMQVLDRVMYDHMHHYGDFTHFYFSYRWLLLDFKRELNYEDVYLTWECIWAARRVASSSFSLFIALALVEQYRDIIIDNAMDFTDVIKFFNEMAEKHQAVPLLKTAREFVCEIQSLLDRR